MRTLLELVHNAEAGPVPGGFKGPEGSHAKTEAPPVAGAREPGTSVKERAPSGARLATIMEAAAHPASPIPTTGSGGTTTLPKVDEPTRRERESYGHSHPLITVLVVGLILWVLVFRKGGDPLIGGG